MLHPLWVSDFAYIFLVPLSCIPGDGNCLFRALADQLWGSPNGHLTLRAEVCDWMDARKERYEGFVDEDRTFATHIMCMRVPGQSMTMFIIDCS